MDGDGLRVARRVVENEAATKKQRLKDGARFKAVTRKTPTKTNSSGGATIGVGGDLRMDKARRSNGKGKRSSEV